MVEFADFHHGQMEAPTTETTLPSIDLLQKQDGEDLPHAPSPRPCCSSTRSTPSRAWPGSATTSAATAARPGAWLSRPQAVDAPRSAEAAAGHGVSGFPRAAPQGREGDSGRHPGVTGIDGQDRRLGAGHGAEPHVQEQGVETVPRHRRPDARFSTCRSPATGPDCGSTRAASSCARAKGPFGPGQSSTNPR